MSPTDHQLEAELKQALAQVDTQGQPLYSDEDVLFFRALIVLAALKTKRIQYEKLDATQQGYLLQLKTQLNVSDGASAEAMSRAIDASVEKRPQLQALIALGERLIREHLVADLNVDSMKKKIDHLMTFRAKVTPSMNHPTAGGVSIRGPERKK